MLLVLIPLAPLIFTPLASLQLQLPLAFSLSHSVGKVRIALVLVLGHLVLEHDHLHLLVHFDLGLVLRFHGLASLFRVRVVVLVLTNAAEVDDTRQDTEENYGSNDDQGDDNTFDSITYIISCAGRDDSILANLSSALIVMLAEFAITPVKICFPSFLA